MTGAHSASRPNPARRRRVQHECTQRTPASAAPVDLSLTRRNRARPFDQESTVSTTFSALATATPSSPSDVLPPLRNPPLLEATEDLTNLSYLNEPSGPLRPPPLPPPPSNRSLTRSSVPYFHRSPAHDPSPLLAPPDLHVLGHRPRRREPVLVPVRLQLVDRPGLCRQAERRARAASVRHRRGGLSVHGRHVGRARREPDHHRQRREVRRASAGPRRAGS